ncbi:hypothetical protein Pyn_35623 [Prunus yedoensis var. nudiflora]|uniref:Uncharacterized protein n=1 Tax=Prunus yedoensis var. nudiflora TaxID=2094558 RepID=A0A314UIT5_PRUYE|nr:hypothetical protein Pyn_35623 [Prunus yedoensis var. nudiflora]
MRVAGGAGGGYKGVWNLGVVVSILLLSVWVRFSEPRLSSIIFLPISTALFDYYAMGIAKPNDVEFFNDLERFLVLMFSSSESIVDKAQETSFEGSHRSP